MNTEQQICQTFKGYYKVGVVNPATDECEWKYEGSNIVLNTGMDNLYNMSIADQMLFGICGVGTRPTNQFGGTSQISQSANTVHLSNTSGAITDFTSSFDAYPSLVQVGDMISCSNGQQLIVSAVNDGFNLTVTPSYTFAPQTFAIYKTSQVGLQNELYRGGPGITNSQYFTGAGNCGTTFSSSVATYIRTYDFAPVVSTQTFNEVGVGWASTGVSNVFSRLLLQSPVTVTAGFKLRLAYQLIASFSPTGSIYGLASIGGWPVGPSTTTNGTQSVQKLLCSTIDTSGNSINTSAVLDPYFINSGGQYASIFASTNAAPLAAFGNAVDRSTTGVDGPQMSKASYTNGSYLCDKTGNIMAGALSSNAIRSIGFGLGDGGFTHPYGSTAQAYCFVFDQPQTVTNTQTLSLTFRYTWGRILG
jgi:hypothetical protein